MAHERLRGQSSRAGERLAVRIEEPRRGSPLTLLRRLRQMFVDLAIVGAVLGLVAAILPSLLKPTVVIEAVNVPLSLEERGYSGEVVSRRLRDELRQIAQKARPTILTSLKLTDVAMEQRLPEIETPAGLSLRWFVSLVREHLDLDDIRISGELTVDRKPAPAKPAKPKASADDEEEETPEPPPTYVLKLRSRNAGPFYQTPEPTEDLQSVFSAAAVAVLELSNPVLAGRHYETARRYDDAERVASLLIASTKPGESTAGLVLRGNVHLRRHAFNIAIADYERVLAVEPGHALAAVNIAWAHFRAGRWQATLDAAERAIAIAPKAASAHAHKANALRMLGRARESADVALAAVDLEPANGQPLTALTAAYNVMRRPQEALDAGFRAIQRDPNYGSAHLALGFALLQSGRSSEGLERLRHGAELDPTWTRGWAIYGGALKRAQNLPLAAEAFAKAVEQTPEIGEFQFELGTVLAELKRHREALPALAAAEKSGHQTSQAALVQARCHLELRQHEEAFSAFMRATRADARNGVAWQEWAQALIRRKRHGEAGALLTQAREAMPKDAGLARLQGDVLMTRQDGAKALEAYEAALSLDAGLKPALDAILTKLRRRHALVSARAATP